MKFSYWQIQIDASKTLQTFCPLFFIALDLKILLKQTHYLNPEIADRY